MWIKIRRWTKRRRKTKRRRWTKRRRRKMTRRRRLRLTISRKSFLCFLVCSEYMGTFAIAVLGLLLGVPPLLGKGLVLLEGRGRGEEERGGREGRGRGQGG